MNRSFKNIIKNIAVITFFYNWMKRAWKNIYTQGNDYNASSIWP